MRIAVVADEASRSEWLSPGVQENAEIVWLDEPACPDNTFACIDLLFPQFPERAAEWAKFSPPLVIVNDVLKKNLLPPGFVRLNGWPSFLKRPLAEVAGPAGLMEKTGIVLAAFNRKAEWVADVPGFIAARVVSMIINEAYHSLEEGVSGKAAIDTAMKLGTNYPLGPFEWAEKIGVPAICELLSALGSENSRYTPAPLLIKEALAV
ncbi:MAG: hypothetical protein JNM88_20330 [Chitinophagaceae bacterium]|nr:hypothetical protein [Chitinophagaceae bacterium]